MAKTTIRSAVIPVAGQGRRMRPLTTVMPKEMLATANGPIIEIVVRELIESGIERIILVTAPGKEIIEEHLNSISLPPLPSGKKPTLTFINQGGIPGNGGAILDAADYLGDEPFIVVWGDELFLGDNLRARQLIDTYALTKRPVIALTEVSPEDVTKCGIVEIASKLKDDLFEISALVEKPDPQSAPSLLASVGGYALTPQIIKILRETEPSGDGEVYLSSALATYIATHSLLGKLVDSEWHETGSMNGYVKAFVAVACRTPYWRST